MRTINKQSNRSTPRGAIGQNLVAHLKRRAIALAKQNVEPPLSTATNLKPNGKIDKSALPLAELKRIR